MKNKEKKRLTKIVTKKGDLGFSELADGTQLPKNSIYFDALGTLDEVVSILGILASFERVPQEIKDELFSIQNKLFLLGGILAIPQKEKRPEINPEDIYFLEKRIREMRENLGDLKEFIIPGGSQEASFTFFARTVVRRLERVLTPLLASGYLDQNSYVYINRLSDYLFQLARFLNKIFGKYTPFVRF